MKISTIKYFVVDSLRGLKRHKTLSIASAATVAATLFILGVFVLSMMNVQQLIKQVESKVEVRVVLKDNINIKQQKDLKQKVNEISDVEKITYETKNDALDKFKEQLGEENESLVQGLKKENPLPNSLIIKVKKPEAVSEVVKKIKGNAGIEEIKDGREIVDKITQVTGTLKWIGLALFLVFIGVSLFLIGNTIKITVYSRKREINIMKYIGATDWFIRWPFIFEGIIIGIIGSLLSVGILYWIYGIVFQKASVGLVFIKLLQPSYIISNVLWIFIIGGVIIGALGSILSIRKFLSV